MSSSELFERAKRVIVGGVNSPVRAFGAVGSSPVFFDRAEGATLVDVDGKSYIDYVGSWGPMILGHAHPAVVSAVAEAAKKSTSFGAPTPLEVTFAEKVLELYPSMDLCRAVSSGTEATMSAIRAARGATGRDAIVKFEGSYHGHADYLLVKAGSGAATFGVPDSRGVPESFTAHTLIARYNDKAGLEALFKQHGSRIAAVIVEPVAGNMGCVPPAPGFLEAIIDLSKQHGAVSIFDEVMTGCRVARGGMQGRAGLRPDMTCLGKIIGGGMPLAVYGGRRDLMENIAPVGPVYQAGTLSGNPVAVSAALATLERLDDALYDKLEQLGARLEAGLRHAIEKARIEACVQRVGSMITLFFAKGPITDWSSADGCDRERFGAFFRAMLKAGVYWPPAQFEAAFISGAHSEAEIDRTIQAAEAALRGAAAA